jgi:hypothetical protein
MSIYDKNLKGIADIAAKIMEASHPKTEKEKELAAMGHPKDKITHKDVLIGRGVLKKEEKESCEDDVKKHEKKMHGKDGEVAKHVDKMHKEESEQLDEITFDKSGRYVHQGKRGAKGAEYGSTDWDKEEQQAKDDMKPKKKKYGSRQNYVRSTRVNESFSEMISAYQEKGLKALSEMVAVEEEVDSEDFEKEMKDQKDKFDGKKKGADVAKASVQAVKNEEVEEETIEVELVLDGTNGYAQETVQERSLSAGEMKKKEEVVKSMKKSLSGFKERYGDRAKEVMHATATKIAKKED